MSPFASGNPSFIILVPVLLLGLFAIHQAIRRYESRQWVRGSLWMGAGAVIAGGAIWSLAINPP